VSSIELIPPRPGPTREADASVSIEFGRVVERIPAEVAGRDVSFISLAPRSLSCHVAFSFLNRSYVLYLLHGARRHEIHPRDATKKKRGLVPLSRQK
jgi:hypothetical protein